jgi:stearoyl-CoA desaturase (Delta-9 desaturase)
MFDREISNQQRFAPDLLVDQDIARVDRMFGAIVLFSLFAPATIGGLITGTGKGALTALIWAGVVRIGLFHHVTWSINGFCAGRSTSRPG